MGTRRRAGRPRKLAPRKPCGRLRPEAPSGPTQELLDYKRALVAGGDPALSSTALDVLRARGIIDNGQHRAGLRYAYLHRLFYGSPTPSISNTDRIGGKGDPLGRFADKTLEAMAHEFRRLTAAAKPHLCQVDKVALFDSPEAFVNFTEAAGAALSRMAKIAS